MEENKQALYFNMILGTVGTILIALSAIRYQLKENDYTGYSITFLGFILAITYINYLEKKAGISKKLTWIRIIVSIVLFCFVSYILYLKP